MPGQGGPLQGLALLRRDGSFIFRRPLSVTRENAAEVEITGRVRCIQEQRMFADARFCANDGLNASGPGGLNKFHDAMQVARVRQRHGGQAVVLRQVHDGRW